MQAVIKILIERAEHLLVRKFYISVNRILDEIDARLAGSDELPDDLVLRFNALCSAVENVDVAPQVQPAVRVKAPDCHKCKGSGLYRDKMSCFACLGKGYQTPRDVSRESDYWNRREVESAPPRPTSHSMI